MKMRRPIYSGTLNGGKISFSHSFHNTVHRNLLQSSMIYIGLLCVTCKLALGGL